MSFQQFYTRVSGIIGKLIVEVNILKKQWIQIVGKSNTGLSFIVFFSDKGLLPGVIEALIEYETPEFTIHYEKKEEIKNGSEGYL